MIKFECMHHVRLHVPLGVSPLQVIVPSNPSLHAHAVPAALFEYGMSQGAAVILGIPNLNQHVI